MQEQSKIRQSTSSHHCGPRMHLRLRTWRPDLFANGVCKQPLYGYFQTEREARQIADCHPLSEAIYLIGDKRGSYTVIDYSRPEPLVYSDGLTDEDIQALADDHYEDAPLFDGDEEA